MFAYLPFLAIMFMICTIFTSFRCTVNAEEWLMSDYLDEKTGDIEPLLYVITCHCPLRAPVVMFDSADA